MELANKFDLIQEMVIQINRLADASGVDKCVLIVGLVQKMNFLEKVLHDEDDNHNAAITELTGKLDQYSAKEAGDTDADSDA